MEKGNYLEAYDSIQYSYEFIACQMDPSRTYVDDLHEDRSQMDPSRTYFDDLHEDRSSGLRPGPGPCLALEAIFSTS